MIGRISGILLEKNPPRLLIDIQGLGYEVDAPMTTFYKLPNLGEKVTLHTHLVIREDIHLLYGFIDLTERELFRDLIKVSNVGPKIALSILSTFEPNQFALAVQHEDAETLLKIPGVGKKMAERLIIEMRDKLKDRFDPSLEVQAIDKSSKPVQDAISALIALGYKPNEATQAVKQIPTTEQQSSEEIIRLALKNLWRG